jgi:hypothetical protein
MAVKTWILLQQALRWLPLHLRQQQLQEAAVAACCSRIWRAFITLGCLMAMVELMRHGTARSECTRCGLFVVPVVSFA